jgi:hypothetical protein
MPNFFLSYKRVKVAARMARVQGGMAGGSAPDLKQTRRDPAQGPPDSTTNLAPGTEKKALTDGRHRSNGQ